MILIRAAKFNSDNSVTLVDGANTNSDDYMDVYVESDRASRNMKTVRLRFSCKATEFSKKVVQYLQGYDASINPSVFTKGGELMVSGRSRSFHYKHLPPAFGGFVDEHITKKRNKYAKVLKTIDYRKKLREFRKAFKRVDAFNSMNAEFTAPKIKINGAHVVYVFKNSYDLESDGHMAGSICDLQALIAEIEKRDLKSYLGIHGTDGYNYYDQDDVDNYETI